MAIPGKLDLFRCYLYVYMYIVDQLEIYIVYGILILSFSEVSKMGKCKKIVKNANDWICPVCDKVASSGTFGCVVCRLWAHPKCGDNTLRYTLSKDTKACSSTIIVSLPLLTILNLPLVTILNFLLLTMLNLNCC